MELTAEEQKCEGAQLTRNLGALEHLIWSTDQWTPRHFVLVVRIEGGSISLNRLHRAFHAVQDRHPALRTAIKPDADGRPRFAPADFPIEVCSVQRVGDNQWRSEVEWQLQVPFKTSRREKILIGGLGFGGVVGKSTCAADAQMSQRPDWLVLYNPGESMIFWNSVLAALPSCNAKKPTPRR